MALVGVYKPPYKGAIKTWHTKLADPIWKPWKIYELINRNNMKYEVFYGIFLASCFLFFFLWRFSVSSVFIFHHQKIEIMTLVSDSTEARTVELTYHSHFAKIPSVSVFPSQPTNREWELWPFMKVINGVIHLWDYTLWIIVGYLWLFHPSSLH